MEQSLAMGGYAGYLAVAYGVTALVILGNLVAARWRFRKTRQRLREQLSRRAGRAEGHNSGATVGRES